MKFCSQCGHAVSQLVPLGDSRLRYVCDHCQTVHYQNPNIVAGCVPVWGTQVLLCRRAIEPRKGYWTLPAGFMELNETTAQGAERETDEEAGAHIAMGPLFAVLNVRRVGQVHLFYRATLLSEAFNPGFETQEARLFTEAEIPWDELAFRTVKETLLRFFADRKAGAFGMHCVDIE